MFESVGFLRSNSALCCLVTGISGKSQVLFALVFTTRYLDLLTSFISLYNTTMKVRAHTRTHTQTWSKQTHLCLLKDQFCLNTIRDQPSRTLVFLILTPFLPLPPPPPYPPPSGHLHRLCIRHRLPDLCQIQGHLRWKP